MSYVLTLDQLGKRYGLLPSEVIAKASTFDLVIFDIALTYERHVNESSKEGYIPDVPIEELMKIKERA